MTAGGHRPPLQQVNSANFFVYASVYGEQRSLTGGLKKSGYVIVSIVAVFFMAGTIYARQNVRLHGTVRDSRTNEPIAKALVSIRDLKIETTTDENGDFEIADVPPGDVELYVTTVGYTLIRRKIAVQPGTPVDIGPHAHRIRTQEPDECPR